MREIRSSGSARGVRRNPYPYRDFGKANVCAEYAIAPAWDAKRRMSSTVTLPGVAGKSRSMRGAVSTAGVHFFGIRRPARLDQDPRKTRRIEADTRGSLAGPRDHRDS